MCWFMGVWTYANAEVLSRNLVEALLAQLTFWQWGRDFRGLSLQLAWDDRGDTLIRCNISGVLWSTSFFFSLCFTCVYLKGMRGYCALRRTQQWYLGGFFLFTSNIPNEYNVRGQRGWVSTLLESFLLSWEFKLWLEDFRCAGCRKPTLQFNTSCCYVEKNMSAVYNWMMLGLTSLAVVSWMQQEILNPVW